MALREGNRTNDESWSKLPSVVQILIVTKDLKTNIPSIALDPSYVNLGNYFSPLVLNFSTCKTIIIISLACMHACSIASAMSDSLWPHGLKSMMLLCPWDFPGKNIGVDCHFLLQGIFQNQDSNPGLLHCWHILYCLMWVSCIAGRFFTIWATRGKCTKDVLNIMKQENIKYS